MNDEQGTLLQLYDDRVSSAPKDGEQHGLSAMWDDG